MSRPGLLPAVFLDRDGVIIENNPDYVRSLAEAHFIPGAVEALARLHRARPDWRIVIATNQSAVGRGLISLETVEAINAHVLQRVTAAGGRIDGVYVCPHHPDENCPCRKPAPGMLLQAAEEWGIDLSQSVMIGDALTDVQAALAAGVTPILVRTGLGTAHALGAAQAGLDQATVTADLAEAVERVLALHVGA
jgi:D-glycero-D-manno-heptose 1,7-bisphosphate phosphatase